MSSTVNTDEVVEINEADLTVRKTYAADEFPVPAIRFEIESDADDRVTFRLVEQIPDSFPMDGVGFHPEYHSDNWTAFQDNHVEFTGSVEPDEPLVTVYGVRLDDGDDVDEFLTEPTIAEVRTNGTSAGPDTSDADQVDDTMIDEIITDDRNQVVKDMLAGESDSVPGLDDSDEQAGPDDIEAGAETQSQSETGAETNDDASQDSDSGSDSLGDEAGELDLNLGDVDTDPVEEPADDDEDDTPDIDLNFGEESIPDADSASTSTSDSSDTDAETADSQARDDSEHDDTPEIELDLEAAAATADDQSADDDTEETVENDATAGPRSNAEAEIRANNARTDTESPLENDGSDDGAVDRTAESESVELESVGTQLATELREGTLDDDDLDLLREELDIGPSNSELARLNHLQSRIEQIAAYSAALEEFLDENGSGEQLITEFKAQLESFESDVDSVTSRLDDTEETVETLTTDVDALESTVDPLPDSLESVESDVDVLETDLDAVEETVDDHDEDITSLESDVDDLEDDVEEIREDVTEIQQWRSELGSMFSD